MSTVNSTEFPTVSSAKAGDPGTTSNHVRIGGGIFRAPGDHPMVLTIEEKEAFSKVRELNGWGIYIALPGLQPNLLVVVDRENKQLFMSPDTWDMIFNDSECYAHFRDNSQHWEHGMKRLVEDVGPYAKAAKEQGLHPGVQALEDLHAQINRLVVQIASADGLSASQVGHFGSMLQGFRHEYELLERQLGRIESAIELASIALAEEAL